MKVRVLNIDKNVAGQRLFKVGATYTAKLVHWKGHILHSVGIQCGDKIVALWADQLEIVES